MDLYTILELTKDATPEDIKKAYKTLANKYHPDKDTGNNDSFINIKMAFDILSDPIKKAYYDSTGIVKNSSVSSDEEKISRINTFIAKILDEIINNDIIDINTNSPLSIIEGVVNNNKQTAKVALERFEILSKKRKNLIAKLIKKDNSINIFHTMLLEGDKKQEMQIPLFKNIIVEMDEILLFLKEFNYELVPKYTSTATPIGTYFISSPQ
jgi:curved DNA-binding protein CbpA